MRSYITFEVESFIRDYPSNLRALEGLRDRLAELTEIPGVDLTRDRVQTSPRNALEEQAITRAYLLDEIHAYESYFRRFEYAYNNITAEQRTIIDAYKDGGRYVIDRLCYELGLEKSRVYELRREAFDSFAKFAI